jgi:hypothetical protein
MARQRKGEEDFQIERLVGRSRIDQELVWLFISVDGDPSIPYAKFGLRQRDIRYVLSAYEPRFRNQEFDCLQVLRKRIKRMGYGPPVNETRSRQVINNHLRKLVKRSILTLDKKSHRYRLAPDWLSQSFSLKHIRQRVLSTKQEDCVTHGAITFLGSDKFDYRLMNELNETMAKGVLEFRKKTRAHPERCQYPLVIIDMDAFVKMDPELKSMLRMKSRK